MQFYPFTIPMKLLGFTQQVENNIQWIKVKVTIWSGLLCQGIWLKVDKLGNLNLCYTCSITKQQLHVWINLYTF